MDEKGKKKIQKLKKIRIKKKEYFGTVFSDIIWKI